MILILWLCWTWLLQLPNPCSVTSGWLHQPNRLGDFFPFPHLTSLEMAPEGFIGSPWEKFFLNFQKWLSLVNPSIFKNSSNFLFWGWFSLRSVPSKPWWLDLDRSHQISSMGIFSLFVWVQRVQMSEVRGKTSFLVTERQVSVRGPLEWKSVGSIMGH